MVKRLLSNISLLDNNEKGTRLRNQLVNLINDIDDQTLHGLLQDDKHYRLTVAKLYGYENTNDSDSLKSVLTSKSLVLEKENNIFALNEKLFPHHISGKELLEELADLMHQLVERNGIKTIIDHGLTTLNTALNTYVTLDKSDGACTLDDNSELCQKLRDAIRATPLQLYHERFYGPIGALNRLYTRYQGPLANTHDLRPTIAEFDSLFDALQTLGIVSMKKDKDVRQVNCIFPEHHVDQSDSLADHANQPSDAPPLHLERERQYAIKFEPDDQLQHAINTCENNWDTLKSSLKDLYQSPYPTFCELCDETDLTAAFYFTRNGAVEPNPDASIIKKIDELNPHQLVTFVNYNENSALAGHLNGRGSCVSHLATVLDTLACLNKDQARLFKLYNNDPDFLGKLVLIAEKGEAKLFDCLNRLSTLAPKQQSLLHISKTLSSSSRGHLFNFLVIDADKLATLDSPRDILLEVLNLDDDHLNREKRLELAINVLGAFFDHGIHGSTHDGSTQTDTNPFFDAGKFSWKCTIEFLTQLPESESQGIFPIFCIALLKMVQDYKHHTMNTDIPLPLQRVEQFADNFIVIAGNHEDHGIDNLTAKARKIFEKNKDGFIPLTPLLSRTTAFNNSMGHYVGLTIHCHENTFYLRTSDPLKKFDQRYNIDGLEATLYLITQHQKQTFTSHGTLMTRLRTLFKDPVPTPTDLPVERKQQSGALQCSIYSMMRELPAEVFTNMGVNDLDIEALWVHLTDQVPKRDAEPTLGTHEQNRKTVS